MMKLIHSLLWVGLCVGGSLCAQETVDVFFAGGQSNATLGWANGIEKTLRESGRFAEVKVVHATHPGAWLCKWMRDTPLPAFDEDFYNGAGTGALEVAWNELKATGKQPRLAGFFWFQGEGDTGSTKEREVYADRFNQMLKLVAEHFGHPEPLPFAVAVIDANPAPEYDTPEQTAGRTRADIEDMRAILLKMGEQPEGLSVDTRGLPRKDLWHVRELERDQFGGTMAARWLERFAPSP